MELESGKRYTRKERRPHVSPDEIIRKAVLKRRADSYAAAHNLSIDPTKTYKARQAALVEGIKRLSHLRDHRTTPENEWY